MNINELTADLEFKYPQIKRAFGSINNFIDNLSLNNTQDMLPILKELLNTKSKVIVIDPIQSRFTLYDIYDEVDTESIVYEKPYSIYNFNRELLYSVSSHFGIFGNSILDNILTLDFKPGTLLYLDYYTYKERKQIILIIGLLPTNFTKKIGLTNYNPSSLIKGESFNQILLKVTQASRNTSKVGLPYYPLTVYYLPTNSPVILNRQSIINSNLTQVTEYELEVSTQVLLQPKESGWLVISQKTATSEVFFSLNTIVGTGVDRVIESSSKVYYVAVDSDININLFKQAFNLTNVSLPNFDNYTGLNVQANITNA